MEEAQIQALRASCRAVQSERFWASRSRACRTAREARRHRLGAVARARSSVLDEPMVVLDPHHSRVLKIFKGTITAGMTIFISTASTERRRGNG